MAGLLAWAADVVGGSGQGNGGEDEEVGRFPVVVFTSEQQKYVDELDRMATTLRRSIQDLRLRIPSPDISQSLPHLHAHSLASNAALTLQLNAHSTTRQQAQLREHTLQEENVAYQKEILDCQKKIHEKLQEADNLRNKLEELGSTENKLREEMAALQSNWEHNQFSVLEHESQELEKQLDKSEPLRSTLLKQLEERRKELILMEEIVQNLERKWTELQQDSMNQPSPVQREKILERQLHGLIEQLTAKQAQAESLVGEIRGKELELERLNTMRIEEGTGNAEINTARNRFGKTGLASASISAYFRVSHHRSAFAGKVARQQKVAFLKSAFVLYILALHVLVFIKISF